MLRDTIQSLLEQAIAAAQADGSLPAFEAPAVAVLRPKQADHGDYSTNVAMVAAAAARKAGGAQLNPRQIAQAILDHLPAGEVIGATELAGPGFINLRLADPWLQQQALVITQAGNAYGDIAIGEGQHERAGRFMGLKQECGLHLPATPAEEKSRESSDL